MGIRSFALTFIVATVLLMHIIGCAIPYGLTVPEKTAVKTGDKAVVLVNIQCTIDNQPQDAFIKSTFAYNSYFLFGLGSFATVGEPQFTVNRFLSDASRNAGWTYFLLAPGIYYLTVLGPDSRHLEGAGGSQQDLQKGPRWRIDVPEHVPFIYAGTLQCTGKTEGELLFGDKIIKPVKTDEVAIRDDRELAHRLLADHFPDAGEPETLIMQRWRPGNPVIIRTPKHGSSNSK
jgi:hypothetical protein